jgi:hypothetical protein
MSSWSDRQLQGGGFDGADVGSGSRGAIRGRGKLTLAGPSIVGKRIGGSVAVVRQV